MRTTLLALLALTALCGTAPYNTARADRFSPITGGKLVELCTGKDKGVVGDCTAYVNGISDTVAFYQDLRPRDASKGAVLPAYICVPTAATGEQLREAVVAWSKKHPDDMGRQASGVVLRALRDTYPCQGGARG